MRHEMPAQILRVDALFLSLPHAKRHAGARAGRRRLDQKANARNLVRGLPKLMMIDLAICSHGPANELSPAANCFTQRCLKQVRGVA